MAYRTDEEDTEFRRKVAREVTRLQRNRRRPPEPLWKQALSRLVIAVTLWLVGEIGLYVHGQMHQTMPTSQPIPHFTSTPHTGEHP